MDLLTQYSEGEGDVNSAKEYSPPPEPVTLKVQLSTAPEVDARGLVLHEDSAVAASSLRRYQDPAARRVMHNLPFEDMYAPIAGPAHPYQKDGIGAGLKNHRAGYVEDAYLNNFHFDEQYNTYHSYGHAYAPSGQGIVGQNGSDDTVFSAAKRRRTTEEKRQLLAKKMQLVEQPIDLSEPIRLQNRLPWADKEQQISELTEEQKEFMAQIQRDKESAVGTKAEALEPTSFFHGKKGEPDNAWLDPPKDKRCESEVCYLPKRWIHSWSGHTKGVNAIRFFPGMGQLLLSAGLDGKIKIWDVFKSQKCLRTYLGHNKGVRDVQFSNDGRRFVSTSYDRNVRLWDTETGKVLQTFNTGKIYYVAKLHPDDDKQNVLMAGCGDKKIYQWDVDTGDLVQEYNYHLGAVNTITFVDEGRRFVTSSDDKTLRVWEFGIPVQIKYIADPSMHSIPTITLHPKLTYFIGQSLDNQVVTYSTKERFRQNRKKTFKGHNTAGYACQVNLSPDGRYVLSGDAEGRCFFWEWQYPHKIVRTMKAHDGVCIGCEWHPMESSKVATCGWDGLIKYWD